MSTIVKKMTLILPLLFLSGCSSSIPNDIAETSSSSAIEDMIVTSEAIGSPFEGGRLIQSVAVYFQTDSSEISPDYINTVTEVRRAIAHDPNIKVYIHGHADQRGDRNYNMELSKRRASSLFDSLGVQQETYRRVSLEFFGEDNPKCESNTIEGLSCNRRVDIYLVK